MANTIYAAKGDPLQNLLFTPGDLVGFNDPDLEFPQPFLLMKLQSINSLENPTKQTRGYQLAYHPKGDNIKQYEIVPMSGVIGLSARDYQGGFYLPNIRPIKLPKTGPYTFSAETVHVGLGSIRRAFEADKTGLAPYAKLGVLELLLDLNP